MSTGAPGAAGTPGTNGTTGATQARRATLALGILAVSVGLVGLVVAWSAGFSSASGRPVGWPQHELGVLKFNVFGALVTATLGATAVAGALARRPVLVRLAAAGFAIVALQAVLQAGRNPNWLGAVGSNLGFAVGLGIGLVAVDWARAHTPPG